MTLCDLIPYFHIHDYGEWKDVKTINLFLDGYQIPVGTKLVQEKRCKKCNKVKLRRVSY